jgi:hypothetical protein
MIETTRRTFLACLSGLALALLAPFGLRSAAKAVQAPEPRLPQVQPYRALVNGEMFNLNSFASPPAGLADCFQRESLAFAALCRFGPPRGCQAKSWPQLRGHLHFIKRIGHGGAVIPSYVWC